MRDVGRQWLVGALVAGMMLIGAGRAAADKTPAPRRTEPAKVTLPVQVKYANLAGEGDGVQAKLVLPARLKADAPGKKVGAAEDVAPTQRSIVAALALSLAALSVVFVLRGKKQSTTTKAAILGCAGLLCVFGAAQADIPVPGGRPRRPPPDRPAPAAKSTIVIEYSADVEEAVLTLPAK